jgi:hypothetical protein
MIAYGARIFDRSSGRLVFSAPSLASPRRVGQVTAGAMIALVGRDGRRREDLDLYAFATDGGGSQPMEPSEETEMNAGLKEVEAG